MILTGPDLMEWFIPWLWKHEESDLIYHESAKNQIVWIRDVIAPLVRKPDHYDLLPEVEVPWKEPSGKTGTHMVKRSAVVVGTHYSKSCEIPVYAFRRPDIGLSMVMRGNFHNWKISVLSRTPVEVPELKMLCYTEPPREPEYTGNCLSSCYFEGFDLDWCFGYYEEDHCKFSIELYHRHAVWTTLFLIMNSLGQTTLQRQHTKEEHRKELAESSRISREQREQRALLEKANAGKESPLP